MKKKLIFTALITFLSLSITAGCKFAEVDENLSAPSVTLTADGTEITVNREKFSSSTDYVNIYRLSNASNAKTVHIGTLYPRSIDENILSFNDKLVYNNVSYKYMFVYVESDGSRYSTGWSASVSAKNNFTAATQKFSYDSVNLKINLMTNILSIDSIPDYVTSTDDKLQLWLEEYAPAVILKTETETKAFPMYSTELQLNNILPESFFNTAIEVAGIVGQAISAKENTNEVQKIYWLEPADATLYQVYFDINGALTVSDKPLKTFTIPLTIEDIGVDY